MALDEALAGAAAGVAGTVLGFPLDTLKARLQTGRASGGALGTAVAIARSEGARGFYRGIASPLVSMTFLNTLCFQVCARRGQRVRVRVLAPPTCGTLHLGRL